MQYIAGLTLDRFRLATQDVALWDLLHARSNDIEARLWSIHSRINAAFRRQLSKVRMMYNTCSHAADQVNSSVKKLPASPSKLGSS
jgi:hypothetical protein